MGMTILFVAEYYPPAIHGGGEVNLATTAEALAGKGHKVTVLTSTYQDLPEEEIQNKVTIIRRIKTGKDPSSFWSNIKRGMTFPKSAIKQTKQITTEKQFDIIHLIGAALVCAEHLKNKNSKVFATIESYIALSLKGDFVYDGKVNTTSSKRKEVKGIIKSNEFGKMQGIARFFALPFAAYRFHRLNKNLKHANLIAISEFVKQILRSNENLDSTVVPNFIDIDAFNKSSTTNQKPKLLYLGALAEHKGPHILLEAAKDINCHIDLYGKGPLKNTLQKLITKNNLDAEIHEPVDYKRIPQLYASADIIVFPSIWPEPFGRISIEAQAAGRPIIASAIGGIKETVAEGTGTLVEPANIQALHDAIKNLINNPQTWKEMERIGKTAVQQYSKERVIEKLEQTYEQ